MKRNYWPKKLETKDHFQPECNFKEEFVREEDKQAYLKSRTKDHKKISPRYNNRVAYEE